MVRRKNSPRLGQSWVGSFDFNPSSFSLSVLGEEESHLMGLLIVLNKIIAIKLSHLKSSPDTPSPTELITAPCC